MLGYKNEYICTLPFIKNESLKDSHRDMTVHFILITTG